MMKAGPNAIVAMMKNNGMVKRRTGPSDNMPPNTPPLNTNERPSEKAASEIAKSFNSIFEKCQNDPVCNVGTGRYA